MSWGKERIAQLQLPNPEDDDPHPRLLLEGEGVHAGQGFTALFPDGWHDITLEVAWESRKAPAAGTYPRRDLRVCVPLACL